MSLVILFTVISGNISRLSAQGPGDSLYWFTEGDIRILYESVIRLRQSDEKVAELRWIVDLADSALSARARVISADSLLIDQNARVIGDLRGKSAVQDSLIRNQDQVIARDRLVRWGLTGSSVLFFVLWLIALF